MCFRTGGCINAHKNLDELNRSEGPAVYLAQPEGLGQVNGWGFAPQTLISSSFAVATKSL